MGNINLVPVTNEEDLEVLGRQADGLMRVIDSEKWTRGRDRLPKALSTAVTSYTLELDDEGRTLISSRTSGQNIIIPLNAAVPFPIGAKIKLLRTFGGSPTVTVLKADAAITLRAGGKTKLRAVDCIGELQKIGENEWAFSGDTKA